jgi:hypothetical protein
MKYRHKSIYTKPTVLVTVRGGIAEVVHPLGVDVIIRDFDNNRELEPTDPEYAQDFTEEEIISSMVSDRQPRRYHLEVHGITFSGKTVRKTIDITAGSVDEAREDVQPLKPKNWWCMEIDSISEL